MRNYKDILEDVYKDLTEDKKGQEFKFGINELDNSLWLKRAEVCVIAARPSHGKTNLAVKFAYTCAEMGRRVEFHSLEMTDSALMKRYIADKLSIDNQEIRQNTLTTEQLEQIAVYLDNIGDKIQLSVSDNTGFESSSIKDRISKMEVKPDVVIVDYIQKIHLLGKKEYEAYTEFMHTLYAMAKEFNLLVVVVSQIGRNAQGEGNTKTIHHPQLHHLKGSGSLEEDADTVLFVHYQYKYSQDDADKHNIDIIVAKNRHGDTGLIKCHIAPHFNRICN